MIEEDGSGLRCLACARCFTLFLGEPVAVGQQEMAKADPPTRWERRRGKGKRER